MKKNVQWLQDFRKSLKIITSSLKSAEQAWEKADLKSYNELIFIFIFYLIHSIYNNCYKQSINGLIFYMFFSQFAQFFFMDIRIIEEVKSVKNSAPKKTSQESCRNRTRHYQDGKRKFFIQPLLKKDLICFQGLNSRVINIVLIFNTHA